MLLELLALASIGATIGWAQGKVNRGIYGWHFPITAAVGVLLAMTSMVCFNAQSDFAVKTVLFFGVMGAAAEVSSRYGSVRILRKTLRGKRLRAIRKMASCVASLQLYIGNLYNNPRKLGFIGPILRFISLTATQCLILIPPLYIFRRELTAKPDLVSYIKFAFAICFNMVVLSVVSGMIKAFLQGFLAGHEVNEAAAQPETPENPGP